MKKGSINFSALIFAVLILALQGGEAHGQQLTSTQVRCGGLAATKIGTPGNDVLIGTRGRDVIHSLRGNDVIRGRRGGDIICGGGGSDRLFGQRGNDKLFGQRGADFLFGQRGKDALDGGRGSDFCNGGRGVNSAVRCERDGVARDLDDIPAEQLQDFLVQNNVDSAAEFLKKLPQEYKEHWIMMTRSESAQKGTATEPRLLIPNKNSTKVFGFCTGRPCADDNNFVEYLQFDESSNKFRFHQINFPIVGNPTVETDAAVCAGCHFTNPRPNWDAYDSWGGMLPFNRDRIYQGSEEETAFKRLLKDLRMLAKEGLVPVFEQLLDLPKGITRDPGTGEIAIPTTDTDPGAVKDVLYELNAQGLPQYTGCNPATDAGCNRVTVTQGGNYYLLPHSKNDPDEGRGVELFDNFTALNAKKVAQELLDHPRTPVDVRPLALAIASGCDFVSESASSVASFNDLLEDTDARRHNLPQLKANLEVENLGGFDPFGLIRANRGVQPTPEEITMQIALRSPSGGNCPETGEAGFCVDARTGFMIDREEYGDKNTIIAHFRLFLEPLGVRVQLWSMGVIARSATYTFADLFSVYISEIQTKLMQALGTTTCDELETLSTNAIDAALRARSASVLTADASESFQRESQSQLFTQQGPDLDIEILGCDGALLQFKTSNVGNKPADGFRTEVIFIKRASRQYADHPTVPRPPEKALLLGPGEWTDLSVAAPMACFAQDIPLEQQGCDVLIYADNAGAVKEPNEVNNMGRGLCAP